jgi:hypothetical protein
MGNTMSLQRYVYNVFHSLKQFQQETIESILHVTSFQVEGVRDPELNATDKWAAQ